MNLTISALQQAYRSGESTPESIILSLLEQIEASANTAIWIVPPKRETVLAAARSLNDSSLPLYGIPFVVKDNIDVAGLPTTAACPDYSYVAEAHAPVVQALLDAGAIFLGKTNLDQFATGLVGVRTPYGTPTNPFHSDYIPGGSSCGSAVAVAEGFCTFSLGTDTAGSGRVPASFNNLVGLKPSKGLLSTSGVVPACRSLDCVSIFTLDASDANAVLDVAATFDPNDPFSRRRKDSGAFPKKTRIGVPQRKDLNFFGDAETEALFEASCEQLEAQGAELLEIDFEPFLQAARLLYEGPWVTERYVAIEAFLSEKPESLHPVTRVIIEGGAKPSAADLFKAEYRLQELRRLTESVWDSVDAIIAPTAGTHYTCAEVEANPVKLNSNLGTYTNFMNLLDFAAVAVPAGFVSHGMPWGITFFAPAFTDTALLELSSAFHAATGLSLGQTEIKPQSFSATSPHAIPLVVCGAHLEGLALNHQLTERGATLAQMTKTAPVYRFYAMPAEGTIPPRPALIFDEAQGAAIEVEVWNLSVEAFGSFVAQIPAPLGIGKVQLADGSQVSGFIAEPRAAEGATEITDLGSWRKYLA